MTPRRVVNPVPFGDSGKIGGRVSVVKRWIWRQEYDPTPDEIRFYITSTWPGVTEDEIRAVFDKLT